MSNWKKVKITKQIINIYIYRHIGGSVIIKAYSFKIKQDRHIYR